MPPARLLPLLLGVAALATTCPAAQIQVRGLRSFSPAEVLDALAGRSQFIRERPAIPSRADDASFLLEDLLHRRGFPEARVSWSIPNQNTIVLHVDEGFASHLGAVRIEGVDGIKGPDGDIAEALVEQFRSAHIRAGDDRGRRVPYLPGENADGVANVRHNLNARGYWNASVELVGARRDPASGEVTIDLRIAPGPLHILLTPQISSTLPVDPELRSSAGAVTGEDATTENITKTRHTIEEFYRARGFQFARVAMNATHRNGRTQLAFTIEPGLRYRVGTIRIEGADEVDEARLYNRFDQFVGQQYDEAAFHKQVNRLYGTGAFRTLQFTEDPRPDGTIDATLHVVEGKPDGYYLYGGAGSYEGLIVGAGYYHRNILDKLYRFRAAVEYTSVGLLGEAEFANPFLFNTELRFSTRAFLLTRQNDGYDKAEAGLNFGLEWPVGDHYKLSAHFENSFVAIDSTGLPKEELGPTNYGLHVLGLTQTFDFRENPVPASEGFLGELTTDLGLTLGSESVSFLRAEARTTYYWPWTEKSHFSFGLRGGAILPASGNDLPIDLRYFSGGANSVRSFPQRELGPRAVNGDPRGGQAYWTANAEYIRSIVGPVKGVLFLDAGTVSPDYERLFTSEVELAAGLGLRLDLPIGPVRFEYGYNLTQDPGEPSGAFHFAIGASF